MEQSFLLSIIANLNKRLSRKAINDDLKTMNDKMYVRVIAKLHKTLASRELKKQLKELNNLNVKVGLEVNSGAKEKLRKSIKDLQKSIDDIEIGLKASGMDADIREIKAKVQRKLNRNKTGFDVEIRKDKAIADIEYLSKRYSKLFSDIEATQKYSDILSSAYSISDENDLKNVRAQIATFNSELKNSGLAAQSTGDKFRRLSDRAKDLFSAAAVIRTIFSQAKEAVSTTIDLDKAFTDLVKVNEELSRNDYAEYLSKCNQKAQELATSQKALIQGAEEFSKSNYDLATSDKLTEKSTILSNVGEMSASDSAKAIISGVQAYDVVDGYTDVEQKAQALIDKYNELGNTASITTKELAQGVQTVGSVFADANTDVNEFLSLLSAGNRQYQDADALALALRTSALRIRGASVELEEAGEDIEGVMSVLKNQEKIKALTGVDILESDGKTIRSIYDIFLDISKVYKDMNDVDQSALLELIAGKHRASAISATLNNMTEAEEILQRSLSASGSAGKEYDAYLESTEAHIQQFQSELTATYSTLMNGDMISHAADLGSAILDLVNNTDLLRHGLVSIAALKIGQTITTVGGAIASTVTQMRTLGNALQMVKNLPTDDALRERTLKQVGDATKSLTEKNLQLLLSQNHLIEDDRIAILVRHSLTEEEARAKLETMGLTAATNANTAANTGATASVGTLKGAFTGLTASIRATWAAMSALQKASIIFAVISTAYSVFSSIISSHNEKMEEAIEKTEELERKYQEFKQTNKSNVDTLNGLKDEFEELSEGVSQYGDNISLTTDQYERYKEIIQQIVGMSPSLAEGYSKENGYIADKNDLLEPAIELQEQEYRNELRKRVSADSLKTSMTGHVAEYKEAFGGGHVSEETMPADTKEGVNLNAALREAFNLGKRKGYNDESFAKDILKALQYDDSYIEKELANFFQGENYDPQWFFEKYADEIAENVNSVVDALSFEGTGVDEDVFDKRVASLEACAQAYLDMKDAVETADASVQNDLQYIAQYADGYDSLTAQQQKFVSEYLKGFGISDITSEDAFGNLRYDEEKMLLVKKQISDFVNGLSEDGEMRAALEKLYAVPADEQSVTGFVEQFRTALETIKAYCEENDIEVPVAISDSEKSIDELEAQYQRAVDFAKDKFDGYDPTAFFKEHSINTKEEIDAWQEIAQNVETAAEAVEAYANIPLPSAGEVSFAKAFSDSAGLEIDNIIAQFNDGKITEETITSFEVFHDVMRKTGQTAEETYEALKEFAEGFESTDDMISNLEAMYTTIHDVKEEVEEFGYISASTLSSIAEKYPMLSSALTQYMSGLITEQDLIRQMETLYQNDVDSYRVALTAKLQYDTTFFANVKKHNQDFFAELAKAYNLDVQNWRSLAQAKADIDTQLIQNLAKTWSKYYNIILDAETGLYSVQSNQDLTGLSAEESVAAIVRGTEVRSQVNSINEVIKKLDSLASLEVDVPKFKDPTSSASKGSGSKDSAKKQSQTIDWIARKLERLQSIIDLTKAKFENLFSVKSKSSNLKKQITQTIDLMNATVKAAQKYKKYAGSIKLSTDKKKDKELKKKVQSGDYNISAYSSDMANLINQYKEYYDNYKEQLRQPEELKKAVRELQIEQYQIKSDYQQSRIDKFDAKIAVTTSTQKKNELENKRLKALKEQYKYEIKIAKAEGDTIKAKQFELELEAEIIASKKTKFDNVAQKYENKAARKSYNIQDLENKVALTEAKGSYVNASYYDKQYDKQKSLAALYDEEEKKLQNRLKSIKKYSDEWYEAIETIQDVQNKENDALVTMEQLADKINEVAKSLDDLIINKFSNMIDEADAMLTLLGDKLVDDDLAGFTDKGIAALGLTYAQMQAENEKGDQSRKQLAIIEAQKEKYKEGETVEFIDANGLKRTISSLKELNELEDEARKSIQESSKAEYTYYKNIIDLVKQRYEAEQNYLDDLISKKKELLDAEQDLHQYAKDIKEQTDSIASLEKQLIGLLGDNSLEGQAKRQKLEAQLKESKESLAETEYDRLISDQKEMLDNLSSEYAEMLETYMKNDEALYKEGLEVIRQNAALINDVTTAVADRWGMELSGEMESVVGNINIVDSTLNGIRSDLQDYFAVTQGKKDATENTGAIHGELSRDSISASDFVAIRDSLDRDASIRHDTNNSSITGSEIKDATEWKTLNSVNGNSSSSKSNTTGDLVNLGAGKINNAAEHGNDEEVVRIKREDGEILELIKVETPPAFANLGRSLMQSTMNMTPNFEPPIKQMMENAPTNIQNNSSNVNVENVTFSLPNVKNYTELMKEAQADPNFENMIGRMLRTQLTGGNRLSKFGVMFD